MVNIISDSANTGMNTSGQVLAGVIPGLAGIAFLLALAEIANKTALGKPGQLAYAATGALSLLSLGLSIASMFMSIVTTSEDGVVQLNMTSWYFATAYDGQPDDNTTKGAKLITAGVSFNVIAVALGLVAALLLVSHARRLPGVGGDARRAGLRSLAAWQTAIFVCLFLTAVLSGGAGAPKFFTETVDGGVDVDSYAGPAWGAGIAAAATAAGAMIALWGLGGSAWKSLTDAPAAAAAAAAPAAEAAASAKADAVAAPEAPAPVASA